ncbi:MAG: hypothetical protein ACT4RN_03840, partial [Pseudonocardia sp.]
CVAPPMWGCPSGPAGCAGARTGRRPGFRGGRYTGGAGIAAATADARFALFTQQVQLPAVPLTAEQLTVAGIVTFVAIVVGTLVGAMLGGKAGERFHRKVDLVGERAG